MMIDLPPSMMQALNVPALIETTSFEDQKAVQIAWVIHDGRDFGEELRQERMKERKEYEKVRRKEYTEGNRDQEIGYDLIVSDFSIIDDVYEKHSVVKTYRQQLRTYSATCLMNYRVCLGLETATQTPVVPEKPQCLLTWWYKATPFLPAVTRYQTMTPIHPCPGRGYCFPENNAQGEER